MNPESNIELSVVSTIYNDERIVPLLVEEIISAIRPIEISFEIILINDGSADTSDEAIKKVCEKYDFVKGLSLSRNFGQQIAMSAGMRYATGKYILIMDGDLQNPPSAIPLLYNKIKDGCDIIYCISIQRNNFFDRITSTVFWFLLVKIFKVDIIKNQLMMKIMTRKFVEEYSRYDEVNRTVSGIVKDIGLKYDTIEVENNKRYSGKSNYNFLKRFNLMIDIIISLSTAPLNFMIYFGCLIFVFTGVASVYYLFKYIFYDITPGFTSIILLLLFFGSVIILMLGFIGRYLSNIYSEVRRRPLYIIHKKYNLNGD
ncbi:MAG: glycosyltransferase family 2 protein [Bacteroidetes bacterium]|nr:glycosyltransferase family 2 protein [Bacteroidota bacterium]